MEGSEDGADEDDDEGDIRVGHGGADDGVAERQQVFEGDDEMMMDDGFDGLEEAAKIVLKKPRLN